MYRELLGWRESRELSGLLLISVHVLVYFQFSLIFMFMVNYIISSIYNIFIEI